MTQNASENGTGCVPMKPPSLSPIPRADPARMLKLESDKGGQHGLPMHTVASPPAAGGHGAIAGAVLCPWLWSVANLGHQDLLAPLLGLLLESLSPCFYLGVKNLPNITARSLIPHASSD